MVQCPICGQPVQAANINGHIDSGCELYLDPSPPSSSAQNGKSSQVSSFFRTQSSSKNATPSTTPASATTENRQSGPSNQGVSTIGTTHCPPSTNAKRSLPSDPRAEHSPSSVVFELPTQAKSLEPPAKRPRHAALHSAQPLAERMRPYTLSEIQGQDLVGPDGVLRGLIEQDRLPSMILWGGPGTGKTTIARVVAHITDARFVEINSTSSGVGECKKLFAEAKNELVLRGRKTIMFCDEVHRFSRSQQDVFLGPVEAGIVTLIGATTENPSFKVQAALLSRCRVFTLKKLGVQDIVGILRRAVEAEGGTYGIDKNLIEEDMIKYLAAFADGDARTGLNLLELAMDLSTRPGMTKEAIKASLTKTLVYDRAGDQHYDTISAFHKSIRGSDPHAALYYLARMLQSGEDALYIARRMIVIASEDVGIADNSLLTLATSAYTAAEKVGMPEARINLAHCTVALALAKKSTRAYRGLGNAMAALKEPGIAGVPIPVHLRNAPTRLMKEMGYGKEYKYNPRYVDGKVKQEYLPQELKGSVFLEERDLGVEVDEEVEEYG